MTGTIDIDSEVEMTPEQKLAFEGFIDVMVKIYKMTSGKIDYSKQKIEKKNKEAANENDHEGRN